MRGYDVKVNQNECVPPDLPFFTEMVNRPTLALTVFPLLRGEQLPFFLPLSFTEFSKLLRRVTVPLRALTTAYFISFRKRTQALSLTPPSVTNTDNRILAAAVSRSIMPAVDKYVDKAQKGFLAGKDSGDHM